ncbi:hypothetical protein NIES22_14160 [Calothrix brevissima NIES-22]|nr:hypothetical protein NIES22_14160 [Calothrix brevissima NIES-22]
MFFLGSIYHIHLSKNITNYELIITNYIFGVKPQILDYSNPQRVTNTHLPCPFCLHIK